MVKFLNPDTIAAPIGRYTHAVETAPNARMLHISGQVGMSKDGKIAEGCTAQAEQIWRNIAAILVNVSNTLQVTAIVVNDSGFDVTFNRAINLNGLNLRINSCSYGCWCAN